MRLHNGAAALQFLRICVRNVIVGLKNVFYFSILERFFFFVNKTFGVLSLNIWKNIQLVLPLTYAALHSVCVLYAMQTERIYVWGG